MSLSRELFAFIPVRKTFWSNAIFMPVRTTSGLLVLTEGSALTPLIYIVLR